MTGPLDNIEGAAVSAPVTSYKKRRRAVHMDKLQTIIARLRNGPATAEDAAGVLNVELSAARRHLMKLAAGGVTSVVTCEISKIKTHTLTASDAEVAAYIDAARLIPPVVRKPKPTAFALALADGRRFHFAGDDEHMATKVPKKVVAADPLALPASFFAPPAFITESPPCAHFAKPAPRAASFPVPASFCFQVPT